MKWSLRRRYYAWIAGLVLVCFVLNFGIDAAHDLLPASWVREDEPGEELRELLFIFAANLLALPLLIALGRYVVERMIRPVRDIAHAAARISDGQIDTRIPYPEPHDETYQLVQALNQAFERCGAVIEQMKRFNGNAAHQLRTPLAALRTEGEVALQRPRSAEEYGETIKTMLERTAAMTRLVEQLLELAALDARHDRELFPAFVLAPHVEQVLGSFEVLREDHGVTLERHLDPALRLHGDPLLIEQVVANILDNALRFTPPGGSIAVHLNARVAGKLEFCVDDSGPGIPVSERESVFERFEQGRHSDTTHTGLGLAIVAEIARVHGGTAFVAESTLGGARVGVTLPLATAG